MNYSVESEFDVYLGIYLPRKKGHHYKIMFFQFYRNFNDEQWAQGGVIYR
jgi:aromatic ring-cleaving dioxygenase